MKNLKKIVRTDAAFDILDNSNCAGTDWGAGGCAILAQALNKLEGYPMVVIYNLDYEGPEHFGVITPSGTILDHDGEHKSSKSWINFFLNNEHPREGALTIKYFTPDMDLNGIKFDDQASDKLAELIRNYKKIHETVRSVLRETINEGYDSQYKSWKRKNVTIRGVKEVGEENNAGAMLGAGLYTAALSNKELAKQYGKVYFVVGAIPKNPKVFNTLNDWEIWFYNTLVYKFSKEKGKEFPDKRDFNASTTIEDEMQKLGYDGIVIKGREMVNFSPGEVLYFGTEDELFDYYNYSVRDGVNENSKIIDEAALRTGDLPDTTALFVRDINQGFDITLYDPVKKRVYGTLTAVWRNDTGGEYYVSGVAAEKGFGPFIYELAIMRAAQDGKGLMPTRDGDIRGEAFNVWKKFYDRTDITKNTLSPDSPYFKFDILFSEDDFDSEEERQDWFEEAGAEDLKTLKVFNTVYYLKRNKEYNDLVGRANKYVSSGFDEQKAIDAAENFWYDSYL